MHKRMQKAMIQALVAQCWLMSGHSQFVKVRSQTINVDKVSGICIGGMAGEVTVRVTVGVTVGGEVAVVVAILDVVADAEYPGCFE